LGSRRL